jgi:hypothetical protein
MGSNVTPARRERLQAEGWTRRFTAVARRLTEAVELYRQLGYEVLLEPVAFDEEEIVDKQICKSCFVTSHARTIYTRPRVGG